MSPMNIRLPTLSPDNRYERHHLAGITAEVVRERQAAVGVRDAALLGRFAAQLQPRFEQHAQTGRADRMTKALEAAVGIDGNRAVEVERAVQHFFPRSAALRE